MGYYSDVALALTKRGMDYFDKKLADETTPAKTREEIDVLLKYADQHHRDDSGAEVWFWKNVKWYTCWPEDFPDVDFIDKLMGELDEEDYYFARVGEEYDDDEIRGSWWDNPFCVTLCRSVVLDC